MDVNRLEHEFTSFFAGLFDLGFGRGNDGIYGSGAEQYLQPNAAAQTPNITINAGPLQINTPNVEVTQSLPPTDDNAALKAEEAAFNRALAEAQQEQTQKQELKL